MHVASGGSYDQVALSFGREAADTPQDAGTYSERVSGRCHAVWTTAATCPRLLVCWLHLALHTPYVPFKVNTTEEGQELWRRPYHYYQFNRESFLKHYHKRGNAETTFSVIKGKFGDASRAKIDTAQVNEVLCARCSATTRAYWWRLCTSWVSRSHSAGPQRPPEIT